ncbi:hypothetical protein [Chromobacterium sphagni]|uniref:Uncharacterized protein n=1 Tax=Chromobacterium sphagni TaxID=1903179 RepID=A0A1S1WZ39_9NEIS|nr:hypothetical protein [Chromobacterium sphagni]OHX12409.1 hypothetical protein BI347_02035 [Chromobacterium sphagni]OHX21506.1 hypothetical protein BI344_02975 [Chromobacterium sphagni]
MLLLKLLLVPTLIWLISAAAKKWGPAVAGALAGFPVITGSILLILALEHGPAFAQRAALAAALGTSTNIAFGIAYSWAALRWRWPACLALGLAGYAAAVGLSQLAGLSPGQGALLGLAFLPAAGYLFPKPPPPDPGAVLREAGMAPRMLAGAALVLLITSVSASLGPALSGLLAVFPVLGSVLAVFSQQSAGSAATVRLLRGMVQGFYAFVAFCLSLAWALPGMALAPAFLFALLLAALVQAAVLWRSRHRH